MKMPSERKRAIRARHASRSAGVTPHASAAVSREGASGARAHGERLRGPGLLAGHRAPRHRPLLDREQRRAGLAVQHEEVAHLGRDDDRRHRLAVARDRHQRGLGRHVVVPEIVVHDLEVPDDLAGGAAQRDHGVRVAVRADALAAVVVRARAAGRQEHEAALDVHGHHRPDVGGAGPAPAVPRPRRSAPDRTRAWGSDPSSTAASPVRASYARTTPRSMSAERLSAIEEPTTTSPSTTAGGEVTW